MPSLNLGLLLNLGFVCSSLTVTTEKANACSPWSSCLTKKLYYLRRKLKIMLHYLRRELKMLHYLRRELNVLNNGEQMPTSLCFKTVFSTTFFFCNHNFSTTISWIKLGPHNPHGIDRIDNTQMIYTLKEETFTN